ncbi:DUF3168 domain-containing protein [Cupriavidus pampae]|uniref:DUF3168 domain-containing protein n=1 Tax=Cupriavidus pampae TaxID=659251 RepID=A0ABM8XCM8_9BURK|nr:DUF3168 domain-containing protein [Cupriavidus pampae]CAG9177752.1 hypothetical protein LMG32289_03895 [Cupriavidus pampae]
MTIEADLRTALGALVAGRVYPDTAPDGVVLPFIVYQQVGGDVVDFLAGAPDKQNGRFQIEVWGTTRAQASALIRQVATIVPENPALLGSPLGGALSNYDGVLNWYGAQQDFSLWFSV